MDSHVDEHPTYPGAHAPERSSRVEVRPPGAGRVPELRRTKELLVALARERAEKIGVHGGSSNT